MRIDVHEGAASAAPNVPAGTPRPVLSLHPINTNEPCTAEALGDRIAELSAHLHAAEHCLLQLLYEFDKREAWGGLGFRSCAQWLSWRTGIAPGPARERVRVARALAELPSISDAMRKGRLSYSKVRAVTRVATPANEADLLAFALTGTAAHVERLVRSWRRVDRLEAAEAETLRHQQRYLTLRQDEDGSIRIEGKLDPEVGAVLQRALDAASDTLFRRAPHADASTAGQRRADALGLIAERVLAIGLVDGAPVQRADRFQVMVHVDATELPDDAESGGATLELQPGDGRDLGVDVPAGTFRRLACDASRVVMRHAPDGSELSVGRRTRTVPPAIRRALRHRDRGCRFPGCSNRFADAHHLRHWADGGETRLDNLVLLCRHHHRAVHEDGFDVERRDDGSFRFTAPGGREAKAFCPPPAVPEAWQPLSACGWGHPQPLGEMTPWTSGSSWSGEPLDLELAILTLRRSLGESQEVGGSSRASDSP